MKRKTVLFLLFILIFLVGTACNKKNENTKDKTKIAINNNIQKATKEKNLIKEEIEGNLRLLFFQTSSISPATPCENKQIFDLTDSNVKEILEAYLAVWNGDANMTNARNEEENLTALKKYLTYINRDVITRFAIIDLDNDDLPEVVLSCSYDENIDADFYCILYYRKGRVYYLTQGIKSFGELKTDGTFSWMSGHSTGGYATISFIADKQENWPYTLDRFTYHDYYNYISETETGEPIWEKFDNIVNHQKTTAADYKIACEIQDNKPDVTWHKLTNTEIEQYLAK